MTWWRRLRSAWTNRRETHWKAHPPTRPTTDGHSRPPGEVRPRQVKLSLHVVPREPPYDYSARRQHSWLQPGFPTLGQLRSRFGQTFVVEDPATGQICTASLGPFGGLPNDTLMSWSFRYSILPSWLRRLR